MKFEQALLASDLDGTLLDSQGQISRENQEALRYFVDNGGAFIIATGRAKAAAAHFLPQLPVGSRDSIILDGAIIYNYAAETAKQVCPLPETAFSMLEDVLACFPHTAAEIYTQDQVYVLQENPVTRSHFAMVRIPYYRASLSELPPAGEWFKINLTDEPAALAAVKDYVNQVYGGVYAMVTSVDVFYEITHPRATKGEALRTVARQEKRRDIYAAGDHINDLSMLETARISFAPASALPLVRQRVDQVVSGNNDHALRDVVAYLDKIY